MKISKEAIILNFYFFFLLIPFVAFQWNYDGYEFPKYLTIILFGMVSGIFILFSEGIKIPKKYLTLYLLSFLISTIFSNNFLYSFYGDYPRLNQNLVLLFSIVSISIIYLKYLDKLDIFKIVFFQSLFLCIITFFESSDRPISTFGQPNFLGIVLVLGIIYSVEKSLYNKYYFISNIFLLVGLIKTASITSIFAFLVYFIYFAFRHWEKYWKYFLFLFTLIIFFIFIVPITREKTIDNFNIIFTNKGTKLTDSIIVRFDIWRDCSKIFLDNPKNFLLGTGPETFSLYYEKVRGQNINYTSEWDSLIDKPHNYFIEILIEQGLLGLFSILYLLFGFYKSRSLNKKYISVILIYLFFNWAHVFLQLVLFLIIFKELSEDTEIKNNFFIKGIYLLFLILILFSLKNFRFEELESTKNFYITLNPQIKLEGLDFYKDKNEMVFYIDNLKKEYPYNLKILYEIYKYEKTLNFNEKEVTKKRIEELRPDLLEWNEVFK